MEFAARRPAVWWLVVACQLSPAVCGLPVKAKKAVPSSQQQENLECLHLHNATATAQPKRHGFAAAFLPTNPLDQALGALI